MQIKVDYEQKNNRFMLYINNVSFYDLPHHLSGQIELNSIKILDGRMAFSLESMRKLKRSSVGHNPITSISFNGISCTSQEDLK